MKPQSMKPQSMKSLQRSRELFERASRVVPGGIYGHQSPRFLVQERYPSFFERGQGARLWDVDGNVYIDYLCGYGPVVLGHGHPRVEAAVEEQRRRGVCFPLPAEPFVELAELLVELTPFAGWALFAKNGSDVTTWSLAVARHHTGRSRILKARGAYHGVGGWANPNPAGIPDDERRCVAEFQWNDLEDLERQAQAQAGELAAILVTPFRHDAGHDQELPHPQLHATVRRLCDELGALYILDDVRCGFRLHLGGSGLHYGVEPDLTCYSKALGNGYPIAACLGRDELREAAANTFTTGSFWTGGVEMAAAVATLEELRRLDGCSQMRRHGQRLCQSLAAQAAQVGLEVRVTGEPAMPYMSFAGDTRRQRLRRWCVECLEGGVLFHPRHNWFLSTAHGEEELEETLEVTRRAFEAVAEG